MSQVTVIIPTFNRDRLISRAIESALQQTLSPSQIIVVDDGSTDNTTEICGKFNGSIEYVRQKNAGVSMARNQGIRLANSPWIAFLDSDDYWTPTHLEQIAEAIEATDGKACFYFTDMVLPGPGRYTIWKNIGFKLSGPYLLKHDVTDWLVTDREPCCIQCSVFSTGLLRVSGGFDPRFRVTEDRELFCRLGIGAAACAVNAVGCIQTSDDSSDKRLGGIVHTRTVRYWEHECLLWLEVLDRFRDLLPEHKRVIQNYLAVSHWRLSRLHWNARSLTRSLKELLRSFRAEPGFLWWVLRHGKSEGWEPTSSTGAGDSLPS